MNCIENLREGVERRRVIGAAKAHLGDIADQQFESQRLGDDEGLKRATARARGVRQDIVDTYRDMLADGQTSDTLSEVVKKAGRIYGARRRG